MWGGGGGGGMECRGRGVWIDLGLTSDWDSVLRHRCPFGGGGLLHGIPGDTAQRPLTHAWTHRSPASPFGGGVPFVGGVLHWDVTGSKCDTRGRHVSR